MNARRAEARIRAPCGNAQSEVAAGGMPSDHYMVQIEIDSFMLQCRQVIDGESGIT